MLQMINHGIVTGALFILVGIIYERTHSRELEDNKALGMLMPAYVTYLVVFSLASFGFPGTNSFVGEFLVLVAAFDQSYVVGGFAILGAILAAAYMLRLVQKMVWADSDGHAHHPSDGAEGHGHTPWDLNMRESLTLAFLLIFVFWIGLHPKPLMNVMDTSITHLVAQVEEGRHQLKETPHAAPHHEVAAAEGH